MFNAKRFIGYLTFGVLPDATALDESLEEHDRKYHGGRYEEGDAAVLAAYGFSSKATESEIVSKLFEMYARLTEKEGS